MKIYLLILVLLMSQIIFSNKLSGRDTKVFLRGRKKYATTKTSIFLCADFLILFIISATRDQTIGTDLSNYLFMLGRMDAFSFKDYVTWYSVEPFFVLVEKCIIKLFGSFYEFGFIFFTSLVLLGLVYKFINSLSVNVLYSTFLFLTFSFYNQSFNIIRQYLAAFFVLCSFCYIYEDKKAKHYIFVLLGFLTHSSAVIGFLIYPLYYFYFKKRKNVANICFFIIMVGFGGYILGDYAIQLLANIFGYTKYLSRNVGGELGIGLVINILLCILYYIFRKQFQKYDKYFPLWFLLSSFTVAVNLITIKFSLLSRIMLFGRCAYIISIPSFINSFSNRFTRNLIYIVCIVLFAFYYLHSLNSGTCFDTVPYTSQILGIK